MSTLFAASAGGHLQQALSLLPRLNIATVHWATYDVPQARELLRDQAVTWVHHPTTKSLPNAVRNRRLAHQVLSSEDIRAVVSTGAGVAPPFIFEGLRKGLPCHYIESATRVTSPSLTGRMLTVMRGVHLLSQHAPFSKRWRSGPSVVDGYRAEAHPTPPSVPTRAFVSLGTHRFPFTRLLREVRDLLEPISCLEITWQLGSTKPTGPLRGTASAQIPPSIMQEAIRRADIVIGHAGVGFTLNCLDAGKLPILMPRRRRHGEHTDDHQVEFAYEMDRRGLAVAREHLLPDDLAFVTSHRIARTEPETFEL